MSSEPNHNRQKNHKALTKKQKEAIRRKKRQRKIILLVVEDGIRDTSVTGVQTCALPILKTSR